MKNSRGENMHDETANERQPVRLQTKSLYEPVLVEIVICMKRFHLERNSF
jgi:hypothetical protein